MLPTPNCYKRECKHFQGVKKDKPGDEATEFYYCPAFPKWPGIPDSIAMGNDEHFEVVEGQTGDTVYEEEE